jgi:hypothetical protein
VNGACTTCGLLNSSCCQGGLCGVNQGYCSATTGGICAQPHP